MGFEEIIVSGLGKPNNPFGWDDALLVVGALAVVFGLEWLIGSAVRKLASHIWKRIVNEYRKANKL
jgi:hypothetical protein